MIVTFRIRIVATDAGSPPMSSECEVAVTVVGGNEYAPKFNEDEADSERRVAIPAGLGPDTSVYSLSATDADSQKLRFAISGGNASDYFRIDSETGKIFTSRSLTDFQPASNLVLEVTVYDGGIPNRTDSAQVTFLVTADNMHAPEFQSPATRIYIREDEQVSHVAIKFKLNDVIFLSTSLNLTTQIHFGT
jgi:protocadherin Fat 4